MNSQTNMRTWLITSASFVVIMISLSSGVQAALFSDNFDVDSSANWNINTSSFDTSATFAFDYSSIGVPSSPNGGGTTVGLRLAANIIDPTGSEALTLSPAGKSFSGKYQLKFDMWINANGPFPGGGNGPTEFLTAGIGYDDITVNQGGTSGSGGWFSVTGEGGSIRDYRAYKDGAVQFVESGQYFPTTINARDPYFSGFGGIDVAAAVPTQTTIHPSQTGITSIGSGGFAWYEVTITVDGTTALWAIDGLPIAELNPALGSGFPLIGNISIGYADIFSSVSDNPEVSFGLIDNLVVSQTPEPATLLLLGMGGLLIRKCK